MGGGVFQKWWNHFWNTPSSIYLASSPDVERLTGKYYAKQKALPSDTATYDVAAAQRLWEISARMVGL